jgi:hypothetical protein
MSETHASSDDQYEPGLYEIRLKGHLGSQWTDWFEGLTITLENNGDTLLTGPVNDQAALHGLLKKVRDLGLPLVSVIPLEPARRRLVYAKINHNMRRKNEHKQRDRKKSAGCEDSPGSALGGRHVK